MLEEPNHLTVGQTPALLDLHRVVAHRTAFGVVVAGFVGPVIEDVVVVPVVDVVPHGLMSSRATLCWFVPERSCPHDSRPRCRDQVFAPLLGRRNNTTDGRPPSAPPWQNAIALLSRPSTGGPSWQGRRRGQLEEKE